MATQRKTAPPSRPSRRHWNSKQKDRVLRPNSLGRGRKPDRRQKISTTIAAPGYAFLKKLIQDGKARSLAEAVDLVLEDARRTDNRQRLEQMTAEGYENMSPEAAAEEKDLSGALTQSPGEFHLNE